MIVDLGHVSDILRVKLEAVSVARVSLVQISVQPEKINKNKIIK